MGTITQRTRKTGQIVYKAEVRIFEGTRLVSRKSSTFEKHSEAERWIARTEGRLRDEPRESEVALDDLIDKYLKRIAQLKPLGRTREKTLQALKKRFGDKPARDVTTQFLVDFAMDRRGEGAGPATVLIDIGCLHTVYREAKPILGIQIDDAVFREARPLMMKLGLIAKPKQRNRRPGNDELDRLLAAFRQRMAHHSSLLPMADLVEFLVYSCMRLSEMTGILWADVSEENRTVIIRNRKHPTQKLGNDMEVALLGPAWTVLQRQPNVSEKVFPFDARSISAAFTRTCQQLGIEDLHLHDLRRHGISRLLELGFSPSEVAMVSGHRSLNILHAIYTNITPVHLHKKFDKQE
ncbi:MAG: tyrosine-type recombinase/integrase [Fluviibacter sp.]